MSLPVVVKSGVGACILGPKLRVFLGARAPSPAMSAKREEWRKTSLYGKIRDCDARRARAPALPVRPGLQVRNLIITQECRYFSRYDFEVREQCLRQRGRCSPAKRY